MIDIRMGELINWKFKCKSCGYSFRAMTNEKEYNAYSKCSQCGSKDIEKKLG